MQTQFVADYVIIGSGIAGLTLALLASKSGKKVALITKGELGEGNSKIAQGGIAAALSPVDSALSHAEDTIQAGQGLCESNTVKSLTVAAKDAIQFLQHIGVHLDHDEVGNLKLGKEGAHRHNRIVHAGGDATGRVIMETLVRKMWENHSVEIFENTSLIELITEDGECRGIAAADASGKLMCFYAQAVILATGGMGQLYQYTTNSKYIIGEGYALAYLAGAELRDMEFVQFHPTALKTDSHPLPLVSEAVRGDGAVLVNSLGDRFMQHYHPWLDLASRDVVSRAIYTEISAGRSVFLDARSIQQFAVRFPTIDQFCQQIGVNPSQDLIPVVPAAHYAMGGIVTDEQGRTNLPRLFAIGEVSSSGLHGANRLASNSLLEGLVMAHGALEALLGLPEQPVSQKLASNVNRNFVKLCTDPNDQLKRQVQQLMWQKVGIIRNGIRLSEAYQQLQSWLEEYGQTPGVDRNILTTAMLVVKGALERRESRGGHYREDYPESRSEFQCHSVQQINSSAVHEFRFSPLHGKETK